MKLTILGSGTGTPRADRNAPGYAVEAGKNLIMLDSGEGTKRQLVKAGYNLFDLNYIFYTHTHVDHVAELPALLWPLVWGTKRKITLKIFGPPKFKQFYTKVVNTFIPTIDQKPHLKIKVRESKDSKFKLGDLRVTTKLMINQPQGNTFSPYEIGYRFTYKGKSLVFCGDTGPESQPEIVDLAQNCDLLILEAAVAKPNPGHLTPEQAGRIAQEARVKKLVLTHFYPPMEKVDIKKRASKYYKGPIVLARDLMKIKI